MNFIPETEMPINETLGSIAALALGLVVGSFLNVVIYRLPRRQSIVFPGSRCTNCGFSLKWYHNIPVFSYLLLGGKCAQCGERISIIYPLVELLTGGVTVLLFIKFGVSFTFLFFFLFCAALIAISFIDLEFQIIPDSISVPGIIVGFGSSFLRPDLAVLDSLIGAVAGGGILLAIFYGYYAVTKREGMGMGGRKTAGHDRSVSGMAFPAVHYTGQFAHGSDHRRYAHGGQKTGLQTGDSFRPLPVIGGDAVSLCGTRFNKLVLWPFTLAKLYARSRSWTHDTYRSRPARNCTGSYRISAHQQFGPPGPLSEYSRVYRPGNLFRRLPARGNPGGGLRFFVERFAGDSARAV